MLSDAFAGRPPYYEALARAVHGAICRLMGNAEDHAIMAAHEVARE